MLRLFPNPDPEPNHEADSTDFPSFTEWLPEARPGLNWKWNYVRLIAAELERIDQPDTENNIMIFCPPRVGKSTTVTESHPLYVLERDPTESVVVVSYRQDLANKFSRATRRIARGRVDLSQDRNAVRNWELQQGGSYRAAGVNSGVTGEGFTRIYLDDPIKGREQADSPLWREKVWETWNDDLRTRRNPGCKVYLVVTRWHEDDLAGRILNSNDAKNWRVVNIPMEAEEDTYYPSIDWLRRKGELINPERIPPNEVQQIKEGPSRTWVSLYQQKPTRKEGSVLKRQWFQTYDTVPIHFDKVIQSWDLAFKDTDGSSFVVGQLWGMLGADCYLLKQMRGHMDILATIKAVLDLTRLDKRARTKLIEDKANGPAVLRMLRKRLPGLIPVPVRGSKVERAIAIVPFLQSANVYVPNPLYHPWVQEFLDECTAFPHGQTDDQVDAFTQAINHLLGGSLSASNADRLYSAFRELAGDETGESGLHGAGWVEHDPNAIPYGRRAR